jgi:hypothetical protein
VADGSVSTRFSVEDGASGPLEDIAVEAERVAQELDSAEAATAAANAALRLQKRAAEDAAFALKELSLSGKASKEQIAAAKQASLDAAKALLTARRAADDAGAGLKAVQAQAKGLAIEMANAASAAKASAPSFNTLDDVTRRTGDSTKQLAERAGTLESSLKAVGGVVGFVSPEFAGLLNGSGEVLGGFEGLQRGAEALGVTLGGVGAAFAVASVAAAAGITAYSAYAVTQERAADAGGRVAERLSEVTRVGDLAEATLRKLTTSGSALGEILKGIAEESRIAAGELQSVIDTENAVAGIRAAVSPELQALGTRQASLSAQTAAAQDRFRQAAGSGDQAGADKARAEIQALSTELGAVTTALADQRAAVERAVETEELLREKAQIEADLRDAEADASRRGADAARRRAEADRAAEQAAQKLAAAQESAYAAAVADTNARLSVAAASQKTVSAIEALAPGFQDFDRAYYATIDTINQLGAALGQAALAGDVLPDEFAALVKTLEQARMEALDDLNAAEAASAKAAADAAQKAQEEALAPGLERAGNIGAAVGGAVSGSLSQTLAPLLDALGPKGMIVSVVLGILEQGPEAVKAILMGVPKILSDLVGTVLELIPQLPTILTDVIMGIVKVLPDLLLAVFSLVYGPFAFELSIALVKLIPLLVKELTIGLAQLAFQLPGILFDTAGAFGQLLRELRDLPRTLVRQARQELIPALIDGFAKAFRDIVRDAVKTFSLDGRRDRRSNEPDDGRRLIDILDRQRARRSRRASG